VVALVVAAAVVVAAVFVVVVVVVIIVVVVIVVIVVAVADGLQRCYCHGWRCISAAGRSGDSKSLPLAIIIPPISWKWLAARDAF
jgi:hypothetical protein